MTEAHRPRLEHANLVVAEIEPTLNFLRAAFPEWRVRGGDEDAYQGVARRWLHFGDDEFYLTLNEFRVPAERKGRQRDTKTPEAGLAHIGFEVSALDVLVARLDAAGHEPSHWGPDHPHRKNVYFVDGEGLEFEFVEYFTDQPAKKNLYQGGLL